MLFKSTNNLADNARPNRANAPRPIFKQIRGDQGEQSRDDARSNVLGNGNAVMALMRVSIA
jgi:hypothetical protein